MEKNIKEFCAITEVNNSEFHLCKTAISSFISANSWFTGTLILINTGDALSNHNENVLKTVYTKFKIILPDDSKILSKLKKKKNIHKRSSFLFTHAFNIKSEGNIFFSKTNLFMKEISSILNKEQFSIPVISNTFPDLNYSDNHGLNHNLMFVPKKYISDANYKNLQKLIIESTSLHTISGESDVIKKFIRLNLVSTEYHSNTMVVNSSVFDNNRYPKFIRYYEAISSLNMDTYSQSTSFNYRRIHNYWKQYNYNLNMGIANSPVKRKPKNIKVVKKKKVKPKKIIKPDPIESYDVSVIIPAFKAQDYIEECIESIINQDISSNIEILIGVDNCEETKEVVESLSKKYSNIRCFFSEVSSGPYLIRNSLIDKCTHENILFFDADDIMKSDLIKYMFKYYSISSPIRFKYFNFKHGSNYYRHSAIHHDVAHGVFFIHSDVLKKIGGFQPWMCGADTEFMKRCRANKIIDIKIEKPVFYRRIHEDSLTQNKSTNYVSSIRRKAMNFISKNKNWEIPIIKKTVDLIEF